MRKQVLKGLTMILSIVSIALVTAVASANGQSMKMKADVPFDFAVGGKILAAGAYTIDSLTAGGDALRIRSNDSANVALRLATPAGGQTNHAKLVFHRYGQRYFLAEVWSDCENGRTLTKSSQECAIQKELSRIASNKPAARTYEIVEIAVSAQ